MTHPSAGRIRIDWWDLANGAFWLDQIVLWLNQADHADQLARDLYGTDDTHLHDIIANAAAGLRAALNPQMGPNQTVTPGPNELDTSTALTAPCRLPRAGRSAHR